MFRNNYFKINGNVELVFGLFNKTQKGLESFNTLINGNNISGEVEFDRSYRVNKGVTINAGDNSIDSGLYDYEFKNRINGRIIDIGAFEY